MENKQDTTPAAPVQEQKKEEPKLAASIAVSQIIPPAPAPVLPPAPAQETAKAPEASNPPAAANPPTAPSAPAAPAASAVPTIAAPEDKKKKVKFTQLTNP